TNDIITTSDRMLLLIKDLLDINAIEQGLMKFNIESFDLLENLSSICDIYTQTANLKQIKLHFDPKDDSYIIHSDRRAITQILDNLLSNAIKFSPFGKNIILEILDFENKIQISVLDEGPGISSEDMLKLFGKFTKLSALPTADESSTGLGLSIAKQYVEALCGKIWCESILGQGAKFIFELPKS
ncbi:MAG: HAMP domain-containing sensor histidine kinase, partial [Candidatus Kapabacteria bacterium]|nr:HAMP domain-containing sensor histidine kinase [Candidatus Kapabacteria bacterium]